MKNENHYYHSIGDLKARLNRDLDRGALRDMHTLRPTRHFIVVARLVVLVVLCGWAAWQTAWPWLWAPAIVLQGFNIFGFIILLHEQLHKAIFKTSRPRLERLLGHFYALPAALSATQFTIWHLDHHNELGSETDDPKRAHLSPKTNRRWVKLLYFTPALFVLYARAAAREAATYTASEQQAIRRERWTNIVIHLAVASTIALVGGGWVLFRVYALPLFFVFPVAFVLNRLGQHYDIDPSDPAKWSTRVDGNPVWHFLFLWSNFHIEHHYYQRVPFYNLGRLNRALHPFFERTGLRNRTYRSLVWGWLIQNRAPHTDWSPVEEP